MDRIVDGVADRYNRILAAHTVSRPGDVPFHRSQFPPNKSLTNRSMAAIVSASPAANENDIGLPPPLPPGHPDRTRPARMSPSPPPTMYSRAVHEPSRFHPPRQAMVCRDMPSAPARWVAAPRRNECADTLDEM